MRKLILLFFFLLFLSIEGREFRNLLKKENLDSLSNLASKSKESFTNGLNKAKNIANKITSKKIKKPIVDSNIINDSQLNNISENIDTKLNNNLFKSLNLFKYSKIVAASGAALFRFKEVYNIASSIKIWKEKHSLFSTNNYKRENYRILLNKLQEKKETLLELVKSMNDNYLEISFENTTSKYNSLRDSILFLSNQTINSLEMDLLGFQNSFKTSEINNNLVSYTIDFLITKNPIPIVMGAVDSIAGYAVNKYNDKLEYSLNDLSEILNNFKELKDSIVNMDSLVTNIKNNKISITNMRNKIKDATNFEAKLFKISTFIILLLWGVGSIHLFIYGLKRTTIQKSPMNFLKWSIIMLFIYFIIIFAFDTTASLQRQKMIEHSLLLNKAIIKKEEVRKKYRHECIWHEIPISRQIYLEVKGLFWSVLLQDGFKSITTDAKGYMVSDSNCQLYLEILASEPEDLVNTVESVSRAYGKIISSIFHQVVEETIYLFQMISKLPIRIQLFVGLVLLAGATISFITFNPFNFILSFFSLFFRSKNYNQSHLDTQKVSKNINIWNSELIYEYYYDLKEFNLETLGIVINQ